MSGNGQYTIDLAKETCVPCKGDATPVRGPVLDELLSKLSENWQVIEEHHLERTYKFHDFREALDFVNRVGNLAEEQNHHPDIYLAWGKVKVTLWTHKINGLHESDFVMAAKIDRLKT
jgi:4a-hydroxytetrahydrobiopterin dehydratase